MVSKSKAVKSKAVKSKTAKSKAVKPVVEADVTELRLVEIVELFTVSPGVLMAGLDANQYRRRKNRISLLDGDPGKHSDQNVYKSDESLQFKVGERLILEYGAIHKTHQNKLKLVD